MCQSKLHKTINCAIRNISFILDILKKPQKNYIINKIQIFRI